VGLSEYEAAELERIYYRHDRNSLRDLAKVWQPGVPVDQNALYLERSRALNAAMESALVERFSHGPSAPPVEPEDDEAPEHGLAMAPGARLGGR
jgi:CPA2 family monovalent cation:H+ antiporter-2